MSEGRAVRTINFTEARSNLKEVLDTVASDHKITIVTRRDSEDAVIMSLGDYNSLQETLYLFGSQANAQRLHAAMAEADASLPAGARILGPEGFEASQTSSPTVTVGKAATKKSVHHVVQEGGSSYSTDFRNDVYLAPRKAASAAGRALSEKPARKTAAKVSIKAKAPVKAKAASKTKRKA
jgi:antitoxin YefM